MIHPNLRRPKMLRNWTGFGSFDKESKWNHVLLYFLEHQIWPSLNVITAIMLSHESSLENDDWTESGQNTKLMTFLPNIRRIIWRIIWTLHMKFVQNETDDVIIGMNEEEELSASSTMVLHIKLITILKESRHNK
jgi:hypothetical protein